MYISEDFIRWVNIFCKATAAVNLNESPSGSFKIRREVGQWRYFAPYIFSIVGEVLPY